MQILKKASISKITKAIAIGLLFGFISYLISGDGGISTALALFLMYLEYSLK